MLEFNGHRSGHPHSHPAFPRRFLRLLSMGCGISRFNPKEVVEASTDSPPHNNPPPHSYKSSTFHFFTSESKPLPAQPPPDHRSRNVSDYSSSSGEARMNHNNAKSGRESKDVADHRRMTVTTSRQTSLEFHDDDDHSDEDEHNCREICRGGSPSFREYCVDSDSRSRSMGSDDFSEDDGCKCANERTLNQAKEKGEDSENGKKERRGKGIRYALHRRKLSGSRGQQQQPNVHEKLLAKAS